MAEQAASTGPADPEAWDPAPPSRPRTRRRLVWILGAIAVAILVEVTVTFRVTPPSGMDRGPGVDRPAASFDLQTLDGRRLGLGNYAGRPVIVNFWASWCPPCREEAPLLVQLARRAPQGLAVVGILYQDTAENAQRFVDEFGVPYATLLDPQGTAAIDYGLTGIPETFFIDRTGMIRAHQVGVLSQADIDAKLRTIAGP